MSHPAAVLVHGSCVAVGEAAVLITGQSGSGKSGMALQMMALGAELVADDGVQLRRGGDAVLASAPTNLKGMIEARGIGILTCDPRQDVAVALVVDLDAGSGERMPQPATREMLGVALELIMGKNVPNLAAALMLKMVQTR